MGLRQQFWVSWSAGASLIANMRDLLGIILMLEVHNVVGTQMMNKLTTQIRDHSVENGQGKRTTKHYTVILEATL